MKHLRIITLLILSLTLISALAEPEPKVTDEEKVTDKPALENVSDDPTTDASRIETIRDKSSLDGSTDESSLEKESNGPSLGKVTDGPSLGKVTDESSLENATEYELDCDCQFLLDPEDFVENADGTVFIEAYNKTFYPFKTYVWNTDGTILTYFYLKY